MGNFATMARTIYQYYQKELPEARILVRIDPLTLAGLELIVLPDGQTKKTVRQFDESVYEELAVDEFAEGSAMEFNLYLAKIGE